MNEPIETLESLTKQRLELLDEKAGNMQRLAELNSDLKQYPGSAKDPRLVKERAEVVSDNADIDAEIQQINAKIKALNGGDQSFTVRKEFDHLVTLTAAYIASGAKQSITEIVALAKADLAAIRKALNTSTP